MFTHKNTHMASGQLIDIHPPKIYLPINFILHISPECHPTILHGSQPALLKVGQKSLVTFQLRLRFFL